MPDILFACSTFLAHLLFFSHFLCHVLLPTLTFSHLSLTPFSKYHGFRGTTNSSDLKTVTNWWKVATAKADGPAANSVMNGGCFSKVPSAFGWTHKHYATCAHSIPLYRSNIPLKGRGLSSSLRYTCEYPLASDGIRNKSHDPEKTH